jgi:hypothetical protein
MGSTSTRTHVPTDGEMEDGGRPKTKLERNEQEDSPAEINVVTTVEKASAGNSLIVLQVNYRSICNKVIELQNLIETHNPNVVIDTESWLHEEINNAELFRDDYNKIQEG